MKMKVIVMLAAFALTASAVQAQELPRKVQNVEVLDLDGKPAKLPYFGEKNLMIFYVDPDRQCGRRRRAVRLLRRSGQICRRCDLPAGGIIKLFDGEMPLRIALLRFVFIKV